MSRMSMEVSRETFTKKHKPFPIQVSVQAIPGGIRTLYQYGYEDFLHEPKSSIDFTSVFRYYLYTEGEA